MLPIGNYNTYAQVDLSSKVATATPKELVKMLYDGALKAIWTAEEHIRQQNVPGKIEAISKALAIIDELSGSLNHEVGGEISKNLEALYDYIARRLVDANIKSSLEPLEEVASLLSGLREAWVEIASLPDEAMAGAVAKAV